MGSDSVLKGFASHQLRCGTVGTPNMQNMKGDVLSALPLQLLLQPLRCFSSLGQVVRTHKAGIEAAVFHGKLPVSDDDRDSGDLRFLQDIIPAGLSNRGKNDIVNTLLDKVADGKKLILLVLFRIVKQQLKTVFFRQGFRH